MPGPFTRRKRVNLRPLASLEGQMKCTARREMRLILLHSGRFRDGVRPPGSRIYSVFLRRSQLLAILVCQPIPGAPRITLGTKTVNASGNKRPRRRHRTSRLTGLWKKSLAEISRSVLLGIASLFDRSCFRARCLALHAPAIRHI